MISEQTKKILLEEIGKYGNIYGACFKLGIDRSTFYRWLGKNKRFKKEAEEALKMGRENICDLAESKLLQNVKNGNQNSIEYVLRHNSDRYRKKETSNVVIVHKKDFSPVVREPSLEEILDIHNKLIGETEKESIKRISPDYELEKQKVFDSNQTEIISETTEIVVSAEKTTKEKKEDSKIIRKGPRPRNKEDRNYL